MINWLCALEEIERVYFMLFDVDTLGAWAGIHFTAEHGV
jgi:hypothetical protein